MVTHFIVMNTRTVQDIFHTATLIAVINVSILAFSIHKEDVYRKHISVGVLRLTIPKDSASHDRYILDFSAETFLKEQRNRKLVEYVLNGDESDSRTIDLARQTALRAKHACDTTMLIRLHIKDGVTYAVVINLLNSMLVDMQRRYMLHNNDFYILPATGNDCRKKGTALPQIRPIYL